MMKLEEIKKCCEFAEGFILEDQSMPKCELFFIMCPNERAFRLIDDLEYVEVFKELFYPLFLQRVIEGINKAYLNKQIDYWIEMNHSQISCHCDYEGYQLYENYTNIVQAKEQAIKYILEKI